MAACHGRSEAARVRLWCRGSGGADSAALALLHATYARDASGALREATVLLKVGSACSNSPLALSKSVLNDYIPKKHRATWASLEAVNTSTWAGSAVLGGFIADCAAAARGAGASPA